MEGLGHKAEERDKEAMLLLAERDDLLRRLEEAGRDARQQGALMERQLNEADRNFAMHKENQKRVLDEAGQARLATMDEEVRRGERDRADLKLLLAQKEEELLYWKDKCNGLEGKMSHLMENAERIKVIESKVAKLGLDRSILKNVQDMLKPRRL
jgi:hypothetical protein